MKRGHRRRKWKHVSQETHEAIPKSRYGFRIVNVGYTPLPLTVCSITPKKLQKKKILHLAGNK